MAAIVEGASIVREYHGIYTNVLTYKRRCDACGYLAPTNYTIVSLLAQDAFYKYDSYEAEGFSCPKLHYLPGGENSVRARAGGDLPKRLACRPVGECR